MLDTRYMRRYAFNPRIFAGRDTVPPLHSSSAGAGTLPDGVTTTSVCPISAWRGCGGDFCFVDRALPATVAIASAPAAPGQAAAAPLRHFGLDPRCTDARRQPRGPVSRPIGRRSNPLVAADPAERG